MDQGRFMFLRGSVCYAPDGLLWLNLYDQCCQALKSRYIDRKWVDHFETACQDNDYNALTDIWRK